VRRARENRGLSSAREIAASGPSKRAAAVTLGIAALFAVLSFSVFRSAQNRQVGDSRYVILLAQNLIDHGDFELDRYHLTGPEIADYRLVKAHGHVYYWFPPGSSILSVPFVAVMNLVGRSPIGPDGNYDRAREEDLNVTLARTLMALFAGLVFLTARLRLPVGWSLVVAAVATFGTQVYSTTSRGLWSDTWGIVLVGAGVFLVLRAEASGRNVRGSLLGLFAAMAYVCRPTNALPLLGFAIYLLCYRRKALWPFLVTSGSVAAALALYSWRHFGTLAPEYFTASRIGFRSGLHPLAANLVSPGRGLLVYVPAVLALTLLLARHWRRCRPRGLATGGVLLVIVYIIAISGFESTGGHSFGPRLLAGLVPWLALLAIIAVDAARGEASQGPGPGRLARVGTTALCAVLCAASVAINAVGATSRATARWNVIPLNVDRHPERIWDWRQPQFLAPFLDPPGPFLRMPATGIPIATIEGDAYVGSGWDYGDGAARWTDGRSATFRFLLDRLASGTLELDLKPYLAGGRLAAQRMTIAINGHALATWTLGSQDFTRYSTAVPAELVSTENLVRLDLPDAMSPHSVEPRSGDRRRFGVAVREIKWSER
jgi:hypothetical protein